MLFPSLLPLVRLIRLFVFLVQLQAADHKPFRVVVVVVTSGWITAPSHLVYHEHELTVEFIVHGVSRTSAGDDARSCRKAM